MTYRTPDMKALERARLSGLGWAVWVKPPLGKWYVNTFRGNSFAVWPCRRRAREYARYIRRGFRTKTRIRKVVVSK